MSILLFAAVLFVLILVHEWGHFIVAKKTGMRVDEFGIGLPPKIFGVRRGETDYTLNALPIGGFVRIFGENAEEASSEAEYQRSFVARPKWAQALVLVAGVVMNVVFAWFLFVVIGVMGVPTAVDEATAGPDAQLVAAEVLPGSPAAEAGLPSGAIITGVQAGEESVDTPAPSEFSGFVSAREGEAVTVSWTLGSDEVQETVVTPTTNVDGAETEQAVIGVRLIYAETVSQPILTALTDATVRTISTLEAIVIGLAGLIAGAFTGTADFSQVAGPVGIVGLVDQASQFGFTSLLLFTAVISLNLAVINMLPFPALDGGRLVMVAIEKFKGSPINPLWVARINTVGFAFLILLMVVVTYNDIARLL